jgi:hypothetical protein
MDGIPRAGTEAEIIEPRTFTTFALHGPDQPVGLFVEQSPMKMLGASASSERAAVTSRTRCRPLRRVHGSGAT